MKISFIYPLILISVCISCTSEFNDIPTDADQLQPQRYSEKRNEKNPEPANSANPYDYAGVAHNEVLEILLDGGYSFETVDQVCCRVNLFTSQNSHFSGLSPEGGASASQVINLAQHIDTATAIASLSLSDPAKAELASFITALSWKKDEKYKSLHSFITAFEGSIMDKNALTTNDKKVILTVASVARYSLYYGKKRKDRDWDTSVANLTACSAGAEQNVIASVTMSLSTGISLQHSLIE